MLGVHALIGLGETAITVAAQAFILRTRPDLLEAKESPARGSKGWILAGGLIILLVLFLAPLASANPDGLERVALDLGFFQREQAAPYSLLSNYSIPFLGTTKLSTILAGGLGVLVVVVVIVGLAWFLRRKPKVQK